MTARKTKEKRSERAEDEAQQIEVTVSDTSESKETNATEAKAESEIAGLKKELAELEDRFLRKAAEFDNYKKRTLRQFDEVVHSAENRIFSDVLGIVDNFQRALNQEENQADFESFKEGMRMIYEQFKKFLGDHSVRQIETVGRHFDPNLHEAVMQVESDEHPEGVVATELAGGYMKGDRVIRHAKVGVSKGRSKDTEE